jgi:DNA-binding MarR family transcriptional regulator
MITALDMPDPLLFINSFVRPNELYHQPTIADLMTRKRQTKRRMELIEAANNAGRELSASTVRFHTAVAARRGLTATEEKALDVLLREGPLSHSELGRETGLRPASVTDLIDRLERKGYAERRPHPEDGRRVIVAPLPERIYAEVSPLFESFVASLDKLYEEYDDEELGTITGFIVAATAAQRDATDRLVGPPGEGAS